MLKTLVRRAVSSDFPTLLRIDKASFPAGIAYDHAELSYFMRLQGAFTLVAQIHEDIAGFVLVETVPERRSATIVTLDVRQEYRRQGCATELLVRSEQILRSSDIARYELQVDVENEPAQRFYRKHGFDSICVLRGYYSNGNDAFLMAKSL